jgi:hypothetical protein
MLGIACCADVSTTSLSEDSAKVDLKLSFRHAFRPLKLITIHAQVKSGKSYRIKVKNKDDISLKIDKATIEALRGSSEQGLIVWVPPRPLTRVYWHATDPRRPYKAATTISRSQYIRPSIRYDLSRLCEYTSFSKNIARQTVSLTRQDLLLPKARLDYKNLRACELSNPLIGLLRISRLAWRHVTKRSRASNEREVRLQVIPYLKNIVGKHPSRYVCKVTSINVIGSETQEIREILLWYRSALSIDGIVHSLLIRIKEEITYPSNWESRAVADTDISQSTTLASWWCKKD